MGGLSEAYENHHIERKFIAPPIDFNSIKELPESHSWDGNEFNNISSEEIPLIDLNDPNTINKIYQACEKWGIFQITNHGISNSIFENVELETKKLFSLPMEKKMEVLRPEKGGTGYGSPRITPLFEKLMWFEGFTMMGNSYLDHAKKLWPHDYQVFCDVMDEYQTQMKGLCDKLLSLMLKSLNIPEPVMTWTNQDPANLCTALQLNSYPTCPDPTKTMGLAQHTDSFLFTILHQTGTASALQAFKKDGSGWVSVDPLPAPDALVVNIGDLLHIISNGRFHNVLHRAVVTNEKQRMSWAYFYGPPLDFHFAPFVGFPGCQGPIYKPMMVKEYVDIKNKLFESTLSSIRIRFIL